MWGLLTTWLSGHNWTPLYYLPLVLEFFSTFLIPILFVALLLWLNVWPHHTCVILLNDIIDLNLLSLGTIVPVAPCYVFYATRHQICWGFDPNDMDLTSIMIWYVPTLPFWEDSSCSLLLCSSLPFWDDSG